MTEALPLLDVRDLTVEFQTRRGIVQAVKHVDVSVAKGETLAIVGESGSGKSVTSFAVMRILDRAGRIAEGSVYFTGLDIRDASEDEMRNLRGREMSMIFQNPRAALNPIRKVGHQIEDVLRQHAQVDASGMLAERAIEILDQVKIARPRERYHAYPFELSGGMCQRVVIALALACRPQLLIADEPTTGLDVTTQKTVMDLVMALTRERGMSTILITHDLGLAATYCDRVVVMEKGHVIETATARQIFTAPAHPYTRKLMLATPRPGVTLARFAAGGRKGSSQTNHNPPAAPASSPPANGKCRTAAARGREARQGISRAKALRLASMFKRKPAPEPETFKAVDGISFVVNRGESVGLVGESGCGKSTTSTIVMRLIDKTDGVILFDGEDIGAIPAKRFAKLPMRKRIQMVFQDPTDSLNPAVYRGARHCRSDPAARQRAGTGRGARPLRGPRPPGRLAARTARPFPASAFRRAEGARRHCARHCAQPRACHSRRTDRRARRLGAGRRAQPAAGTQRVAGHELSVRVARPQRRAAVVRSRHRHAVGQDRRAGAERARAVGAGGAVYARPPGGNSPPDIRAGGVIQVGDGRCRF